MRLRYRQQVPGALDGVTCFTTFGYFVNCCAVLAICAAAWIFIGEDHRVKLPRVRTVFQENNDLLRTLIEEVKALRSEVRAQGSPVGPNNGGQSP